MEMESAALVRFPPTLDDRGFIYIADRAGTNMHILQLSGDAQAIANRP